jgi:hypothetical protein
MPLGPTQQRTLSLK